VPGTQRERGPDPDPVRTDHPPAVGVVPQGHWQQGITVGPDGHAQGSAVPAAGSRAHRGGAKTPSPAGVTGPPSGPVRMKLIPDSSARTRGSKDFGAGS